MPPPKQPQAGPYARPRWRPPPPTKYPPLQPLPPIQQAPTAAATAVREIGRSVNGTPIMMYTFGTAGRPALVFGGIHGDEGNSSVMAERLIEYLRANPQFTANRTIAVIPRANPDGLAANSRWNVRGVDLNRNFPASNWKRDGNRHGSAPLSEPESAALARVVRQLQPRLIISLHSIRRQDKCNNFDGPAGHIAALMSRLNGYRAVDSIGYPTPGSFGTWAGKDLGIATITLEIPKAMSGDTGWAQNQKAILAALQQ
jgi:protein MpaA